ncbi:MAG: hypothetical protein CL842_03330 [Crocinitomicaceae bacterium]|nr:hypothetical protein [Crocinitomicaceae bacterium]|tara:strand:- start:55175 stop:56440 length:1266 start_codon:yes stop_codon:yes gene_type:complete
MAKSDVLKNISLLSSGTVLAQLIPLLFAPWIARIFDAKSFGEFAAIMGILNILSVIVNGRYELAVVLPKKVSQARALIIGTWGIGLIISVTILALLNLFKQEISSYFEIAFTFFDSILVFVCLIGIAFWQPMNYFFIREKQYLKMTYNKFAKSISTVFFTILVGVYFADSKLNGLVIGMCLGWVFIGIFTFWQGVTPIVRDFVNLKEVTSSQLREYVNYPKFNAVPAVLNSLASQLGLYVFVYYFSTEIAGHYSFSKQYLYVPLSILGVSLSQVYFQRMSEKFKNKQSVIKELKILFAVLASLSTIVCLVVVFFSVELFDFIFGSEWLLSASISKKLVFAFGIQFMVSPLSMILHAINQVKLASIFPIVYLISMLLLFSFGNKELDGFVTNYVIAEVVPYLIYLGLIIFAVVQYERRLINM